MQKKSAAKAPFETFTQPSQCDLRLSDAKQKSITLAAAAARNLDAPIPMTSADTKLQSKIELRTTVAKHYQKSQDSTAEQVPSTSVDATIPLRSADTELQHTIELQSATVEHIAWMQQFQCTKPRNTCKTQ